MSLPPLLHLKDLSVSFRTLHGSIAALDRRNLTLAQGELRGQVCEPGSVQKRDFAVSDRKAQQYHRHPIPVIEPVAAGVRQISRLLRAKRG